MLRFIFGFISIFFAVPTGALAQNIAPNGNMQFSSSAHNFGKIKEVDGIVVYKFSFKNIGKEPIVINYVNTTCGCTTPTYSKEPVMPGAEGYVEVAYNPAGVSGYFNKQVFIMSNSRKNSNGLTITGEVEPRPRSIEDRYPVACPDGLRMESNNIYFSNIPISYSHTKMVNLYNASKVPVKVASKMVGSSPGMSTYVAPAIIPAGGTGQLFFTVDARANIGYGTFRVASDLFINGVALKEPIKVSGSVIPDFSLIKKEDYASGPCGVMDTQFHHFGNVGSEALKHTFVLENKGRAALQILSIQPSSGRIIHNLNTTPLKPGERRQIEIRLNTDGLTGRIAEELVVVVNDPGEPIKSIRLVAFKK